MRARAALPILRSVGLRLLFGSLSLLFISFVTFVADEIAPGDAAIQRAGDNATEEQIERLRTQMGLDRPWTIRYVEFVGNAVRGDLGTSFYGLREPVADRIAKALPMTLRLAGMAILLAAGVGLLLGTIAAIHENRVGDRIALGISTLGVTVPNFVLAPVLVYIFALRMDVLPMSWSPDRVAPDIYYLILPTLVMAARPMAQLTRLTRASVVESLRQEFVRLAIAKGVPQMRLIVVHVLRNAILPVVTAIGTSFGFLLTGSFIVETIFTMPGLGSMTIEAIRNRDTALVQGCVLVAGALFVLANLVVDLLLPILDPRIREAEV